MSRRRVTAATQDVLTATSDALTQTEQQATRGVFIAHVNGALDIYDKTGGGLEWAWKVIDLIFDVQYNAYMAKIKTRATSLQLKPEDFLEATKEIINKHPNAFSIVSQFKSDATAFVSSKKQPFEDSDVYMAELILAFNGLSTNQSQILSNVPMSVSEKFKKQNAEIIKHGGDKGYNMSSFESRTIQHELADLFTTP